MNITFQDLEKNIALEKTAMASFFGGAALTYWHNEGPQTLSVGNYSVTPWSAWFKSGFVYKRYRDRYRTLTIRVRQHKREYQYKSIFRLSA